MHIPGYGEVKTAAVLCPLLRRADSPSPFLLLFCFSSFLCSSSLCFLFLMLPSPSAFVLFFSSFCRSRLSPFRSPPLFCFSLPYPLLPYALPLSISLFVLFKRFPTLCFFLPMLPSSPSFSFFFFLCFSLPGSPSLAAFIARGCRRFLAT